jgi:Domain of unknown function (DUF4431)
MKEAEMKLLVSLLLLFGGGFSPNAQMPQDCLSYDPTTVTLKGKLSRKTFAGPPNYESVKKGDAPETYWILHLTRPICVSGDEPEKNVSDIQLFLSEEQYARHKDLLGKRVVVSGKLWHASTGHHHTNVLLNVAGIKGARQ